MAQKKHIIITLLEYIPVVIVLFLIRLLPYKTCLAFARALGRFAFRVVASARREAIAGLTRAFPDWDAARVEETARASFEHMLMTFIELTQFPKLDNDRITRLVRIEGEKHLTRALAKGKGVIGLAAHLGSWEYMSAIIGVKGYAPAVIVRPLDNPLLDKHVERYRAAKGAQVISRFDGFREMVQVLKENRILGFLVDQNWAVGGVFAPFFGTLAATTQGPIRFALMTGAPLIPFYDVRHPDGTHTVHILPEVPLREMGTREETIRYMTAKYTRLYEEIIRMHPEQWLWVHPRWRSVPPEGYDATYAGDYGYDGLYGESERGRIYDALFRFEQERGDAVRKPRATKKMRKKKATTKTTTRKKATTKKTAPSKSVKKKTRKGVKKNVTKKSTTKKRDT